MVNLWNSFEQFANDFSEFYYCNSIVISNNYEIKVQVRNEVIKTKKVIPIKI
jgi:hypothetical protein